MWTVAGGSAVGVLYALSPLTVCVIAAAVLVLPRFARGLPADERWWLTAIVAAAVVARLVVITAMFVRNVPYHDDVFVGATGGDEAYGMSRALRARHIVAGSGADAYDYFVTYDEYGRNSYIAALTRLQALFGRAPYGVRFLNSLLFTIGALLLYRTCRSRFGALPALGGLIVVLFWPTLFVWSISLLKESLYFFAAAAAFAGAVAALRSRRWIHRVSCVAVVALGVWLAADLRPGAATLLTLGLITGAALAVATASARTFAAFASALVVAGLLVFSSAPARERIVRDVATAAKTHSGHVFTVGHSYKLLDAGFYLNPVTPAASTLTLSGDQAARFVLRAAAAFVVVPLPWQLQSIRELTYLPEQVAWYVLVALLPVGIAVGLIADRLVTCLLIGYAAPTAAALALTSGNVGTLLRLRGLVIPILAWLSVVGFCAALGMTGPKKTSGLVDERGRLFGRVNLFDAALVALAIVLIPVAYGLFLLFRTPPTRIVSVTRVPITREERRVAGTRLVAKLKVRGTALRPMLRASIGDTPALGFVFEDPNSADVLVGDVPAGVHDLVLYDGVQEIARLAKSVTIETSPPRRVAVVGTLLAADAATLAALERLTGGNPVSGPGGPGLIRLGPKDASTGHQIAEFLVQCDPDPNQEGCAIGGTTLNATPPPVIKLPGPDGSMLSLAVRDVFPGAPATPATARVRFETLQEVTGLLKPGDRDDTIDDRAAVLVSSAVTRRNADRATVDAVLRLGLDSSADGWRYRGVAVKAGAPFRLATDRYVVDGTIVSVEIEAAPRLRSGQARP